MLFRSLYADENGVRTNKRRTARSKIAKIRLKAAKRSFAKQWPIYKQAKRFRIADKQKQRLFDIMNHRIELTAYLAELRYRKKHENVSGKPKHMIKKEMYDTKKLLRLSNRDFDKAMAKCQRRSDRRAPASMRIFFTILTIGVVIAAYFGVQAFLLHKDEILNFLPQGIADLVSGIKLP